MICCTHCTVDRYSSPMPAVFFDRDGTLIEYRGFITEPSQVELVDGATDALQRLRDAGYAIILASNQSAIGRGMITHEELKAIHDELVSQLSRASAKLDAIYYCPEAPIGSDETVIESPDRKPGPGMLRQAAEDLNLDLAGSWMIGDRLSDVLAGKNAGCRGSIRVPSGRQEASRSAGSASWGQTAQSLAEAANLMLAADD